MSVDSVFVHKMWVDHELSKMVKSGKIPFPMLSDAGGKWGPFMAFMTRMPVLRPEEDSSLILMVLFGDTRYSPLL